MTAYEGVALIGIFIYFIALIIRAVRHLIFKLTSVKFTPQRRKIFIVAGAGFCEDLEFRVRAAAAYRFFTGCNAKIMILNLGFDDETRRVARILAKSISGVEVYKNDDFKKYGFGEEKFYDVFDDKDGKSDKTSTSQVGVRLTADCLKFF